MTGTLAEGSVQWDDRDVLHKWLSANEQSGTIPHGEYDKNTKIYYCCQNNEKKWSDPIELPLDRPFYLLPHSSNTGRNCQLVKGATIDEEYIDYDTEDSIYKFGFLITKSIDSEGFGNHVFFEHKEKTSRYMRAHYCYYKGN